MNRDLDLGGVLVTPFAAEAVLAFGLLLLLRPVLRRVGFRRYVWNPALMEAALFACLLGLLYGLF